DCFRPSRTLGERSDELAAAPDGSAQDVGAKASGDTREPRVMALGIGGQRAREPSAGVIEPLARQRQQFLGAWQGANGCAQLRAPCVLAAMPAGERAMRQAVEAQEQVRPHRNRQLRRRGGRRRAHVGGRNGKSCLRAGSNSPSAASLFLRSSINAMSAPTPAGSSVSTTIWYFDCPG